MESAYVIDVSLPLITLKIRSTAWSEHRNQLKHTFGLNLLRDHSKNGITLVRNVFVPKIILQYIWCWGFSQGTKNITVQSALPNIDSSFCVRCIMGENILQFDETIAKAGQIIVYSRQNVHYSGSIVFDNFD